MNKLNYQSDYLKTHENELKEQYANFFNKIHEIEGDLRESGGDKCLEWNCDDLARKDYAQELENFKALISINAELLLHLEHVKAGNCDDIDVEMAVLSKEEQKAIYLKRIQELSRSKHLAIRVLSSLTQELDFHQQREHDHAVTLLMNEHLIDSQRPHLAQIENDVNNEVQRLEKVFARNYRRELKVKHKFDRLDRKLAGEIIPRLTQLEREILDKIEELRKVDEEIEESRVRLEESMEIEEVYGVKLRNLTRDRQKLQKGNERMEKYLTKLRKGIVSHQRKIEQFNKKFDADLICMKENAGVAQRIKELEVEDLESKLKNSKETTICRLRVLEATARNTCQQISKILQNISQSNATIDTFERNLKILRSDGQ